MTKLNYSDANIKAMIQGIEDGSITVLELPVDYYEALVKYLTKAVFEGFGADLKSVSSLDMDLLEELVTNVYTFGAAKTFQQTSEISSLLVDDEGNVRSSQEFNELARKTYDNWNDNWGRTEYTTAVGQANNASKWAEIERQKDILPSIRYDAVLDPNTSEICAPLDGIVAPVDDPIWDKIMPLNHFNCFVGETEVLTPIGWKRIDSLSINDVVIGGSGKPQNIGFVHINNINDEVINISIKNHSVTSTKNHRFLTINGWKRAENITIDDVIVQNIQVGFFNKLICTINNIYIIARYLAMPIIRKWEARMINTFNSNVQRWDKNINKPTIHQFIANTFNAFAFNKIKNNLFAFGKFFMVHFVSCRLILVSLYSFIIGFFSNTQIKHRVVNFHSSRSVGPFASESRRGLFNLNFFQPIRSIYTSLFGINPLSFYSLATNTSNKSVFSKKPHQSSIINIPFIANLSKCFELNKVNVEEGFTAGQPLDSFNSLFNFLLHSLSHRKLVLVNNITNIQHIGNIYNLFVNNDESYITKVGVVHNCRCVVLQTDEDATKGNAEIVRGVTDDMQDLFINNSGKTGTIFNKDHPYFDVSKEYKEFALENFGLPIPNFKKD